MPPGEMPLYLHIVAKSQVILDAAVGKVNELIDQELGPLIEERTLIARARATGQPLPPGVGQRQKWPEEKLFIGLDPIRNFNIRAKVVGPGVSASEAEAERGQAWKEAFTPSRRGLPSRRSSASFQANPSREANDRACS